MKNKRNIVLLMILLVLVAAMIVFLLTRSDVYAPTVGELTVSEEDKLTDDEIQVEVEKCEKEKSYFQAACFQNLATLTRDADFCDRIGEILDAGYDGTGGLYIDKGICLAEVAKLLDYDFELCVRVKDNDDFYNSCIGNIAIHKSRDLKDASACDRLSVESGKKEQCLAVSVTDESEVSVCDQLEEEFRQKICRNSAYQELSEFLDDVEYCHQITNEGLEAFCVGGYAQYSQDLSICDSLNGDQNVCSCYNLYFDELNQGICDSLKDEEHSATCERCLELDLFQNL